MRPVARPEGIPGGVGRPTTRKISHFYVKFSLNTQLLSDLVIYFISTRQNY
jgi:hypothetical protein